MITDKFRRLRSSKATGDAGDGTRQTGTSRSLREDDLAGQAEVAGRKLEDIANAQKRGVKIAVDLQPAVTPS
ncbi:hypothetical protein [Rhizobium sullae]|uniref:hypothetical protein n=1 Tax=Rhizobium sullae TaxID=50338 RepID=UPI001FCD8EEE|nr:hypothetical protein [Rhizobium sullae]